MDSVKDAKKINRRTFFTKSIGYTAAGISALTLPGMVNRAFAANGDRSKEEIIKEIEENAAKLYPVYHSCSQPTLAALNTGFNLKADQTVTAIKLFAGGIVGKGETCGAVTGALLAIGFYFEPQNQGDMSKSGSSMIYGRQFFDRFTQEFGSIRCREVIKHQYGRYFDFGNMEDMQLFAKEKDKGKCIEVIKKAVRIASDLILAKA